jgi:hypothetical protein
MMDILVTGRQQAIGDAIARELDLPDTTVHIATTTTEVADVMEGVEIAHVFIGPGLDLATRLKIVQEVLLTSDTACIHLKDTSRGPEGALDFVRAIVTGLRSQYYRTST